MAKRKSTKGQTTSTKHTHKTKDRVTRTPLKTGGDRRCCGRVGSSSSASDTRSVPPLGWSLMAVYPHMITFVYFCISYYVLLVFVLCTLCTQFPLIVQFLLFLRYSLAFIMYNAKSVFLFTGVSFSLLLMYNWNVSLVSSWRFIFVVMVSKLSKHWDVVFDCYLSFLCISDYVKRGNESFNILVCLSRRTCIDTDCPSLYGRWYDIVFMGVGMT
jgi:hypothetical protein